MGGDLTLADYCIVPVIDRMNDLGYSSLWENHDGVSTWYKNVQQRDAYRKTYYKGTRLSEIYDGAEYGAMENVATIVKD